MKKMVILGAILATSLVATDLAKIVADHAKFEASKEGQQMVKKDKMASDGIVRVSRVEVATEHLSEYLKYATKVGEISLATEPGVLSMYAMSQKDRPELITIIEIYASQAAYKSHIASDHFQRYKKGTLHMVKDLELLDQTPLNPRLELINLVR